MVLKEYKNSGKKISLLGFGCMRFPRLYSDRVDIDSELSQKMIDYAYQNGVNYFDTAYPYHGGQSEIFIGKALKKYPRDSFYLADKMPGWLVNKYEDVEKIFDEQLKRCQVDYFDFYLCHALGKENLKVYDKIDIYSFLFKKKQEGKIRHLGFSFHDSPDVLEYIVDKYQWDFAQIQLNYLDWKVQNARIQYEILEKNNLPCIVMEPVRGGTLSTLCEDSVKILKNANPNESIASWAIRFAASLPNVMTVLSGMSTFEQVKDNVDTISNFKKLTDDEYLTIENAVEQYCKSITIPCTGCRYCMDCDSGVDIPEMFKLYNQYILSKAENLYIQLYSQIDSKKQAHNCISCNKCVKNCPQKIDIPENLKKISQCILKLTAKK